ncbi:MAG: type B 50S ribosomal protein L31, partial [Gemmatimonadetes bacterium]|nr:type B 50S ribosomal protein L31 [Gemmatimonadota bacterium]
MKPGIHPEYRPVVFRDASNGMAFITRSTIKTDRTIEWEDGQEYPLYTLEISAASHPFYTGTQRMLDTAGRVERFKQRYSDQPKAKSATPAAEAAEQPKAKAAAKPKAAAK